MRRAIHFAGLMMFVPCGLALFVAVTALLLPTSVPSAFAAFAVTAGLSLTCGLLAIHGGESGSKVDLRSAMAATALGWLCASLLGAVPFVWIAMAEGASNTASAALTVFADPYSALFESVSGFTSTGLTMVASPSDLPAELILWRSLTQWTGGFGIMIIILIFADPSDDTEKLFDAETGTRGFADSPPRTALLMLMMYLVFTVSTIGGLWASGMTPWDALNYGLTSVSTGGFSSADDSASGQPLAAQVLLMFIMVLAAISFATYARALKTGPSSLFSRQSVGLIVGIGLLIALLSVTFANSDTKSATIDIVFQAVSAFTTSGFSTTQVSSWPTLAVALLMAVMIVGAAAGSTAGGIKLVRVLRLWRSVLAMLNRAMMRPTVLFSEETRVPSDIKEREGNRVEAALTLSVLWFLMISLATIALVLIVDGHPFRHILFDVTSALGGVGLSAGVTGAELPGAAKVILVLLMWLGRLEIIPAIVLVTYLFKGEPKSEPLGEAWTKE